VTRVKLDSSRRLYLQKELVEDLGESFHAVRTGNGLRMVPVPENPVKDLRERTSKIRESDKSVGELQREARERLTTCS
jgi:hypothetical protein